MVQLFSLGRLSASLVAVCALGAACENAITIPGPSLEVGEGEGETPPPPVNCDDGLVPSAVPVLPRTSTHEFQRFVSDLLGAPVGDETFARWTPLAKVWGFDTMTEARIDGQTFDEQWQTTEALAAQLVASPRVTALCPTTAPADPVCPLLPTYSAQGQYSGQQGANCWGYFGDNGAALSFVAERNRWEGAALIWDTGLHPSAAGAMRRFTAPVDGAVTFTGSFYDADPGGGDGVTVIIRRPGAELFRQLIPNASAAAPFAVNVTATRGETFDFVVERNGDTNYDTTGLNLDVAFTAAPSSAGLSWESCGQAVLADLGGRAFRRPLRADELVDLQTVFNETRAAAAAARTLSPFHDGLQAALQAVLLSPNVQYKPELVPGGFGPEEESYRRAARLALYFRSSLPDDALWALAQAGGLQSDAEIAAEAERLLAADPEHFVQSFAGQWLDFRKGLATATETPLQQAMRREAHEVFAAVLRDDLPPTRLINPGFTYVDADLAGHYGFAADFASAPGMSRVETADRGGLFTQGHFLTSTATGTDFRRVIHRGLWTLTRAMCESVPQLDPATREEINGSVGQIDPAAPLAEQMEIHRNSSARCNSCHAQMDPLGLALEQYDANGQFRETYADGSVIDNSFDFHGTSMRNAAELSAYMESSGEFERCAAEKLLTFGLHRAPFSNELCLIERLAGADTAVPPSLHQMTIDAFVASLRLTDTTVQP